MEESSKQLDLDGEPPEVDLILAEVDNLIVSAEIRLERHLCRSIGDTLVP